MKINELKKVGERLVERAISVPAVYDEQGNLIAEAHESTITEYEPIMEIVARDMTPEEIAEYKAMQWEQERDMFYAEKNRPLDDARKMELFIQSLPVDNKPTDRPGYIWEPIFKADGTGFGWEEIADPYYVPVTDGSYINPFNYVTGAEVEEGKWYTDGDNIWEAIASGVPSGFDDKDFFDII